MGTLQRQQVMALIDGVKEKLTNKEYKDIADALHKPKPVDINDAKLVKLTYEEHSYPDMTLLWNDVCDMRGLRDDDMANFIGFSHHRKTVKVKSSIHEVYRDKVYDGVSEFTYSGRVSFPILSLFSECVETPFTDASRRDEYDREICLNKLTWIVPLKVEVLQRLE